MTKKTQFQRQKERKHDRVVKLFLTLDGEEMARDTLFAIITRRTGYSRPHIYAVLTERGIDYRKKKSTNH